MAKATVLVVEDNALLRMDASERIEQAGFEVLEACDADEAIRILEDRPEIHLVFTDVEMPGSMDGIKLAAYVRDRWPPVHIIVCSGRIGVNPTALPVDILFFTKPPAWPSVIDAMRRVTAV